MDYSKMYEIRSIKEVETDPKTGDIIGGIELNEPLVNSYDAGTKIHVFPYANKLLIVSKSLDVTLDQLLTEIITPDEAVVLQEGMNKWEALNKFAELIAELENFTTSEELEQMDGWLECKLVAEQAADTILIYNKDDMINLYNNLKSLNWVRNVAPTGPAPSSITEDNIQVTEVCEERTDLS